jgi:hypothetical protein
MAVRRSPILAMAVFGVGIWAAPAEVAAQSAGARIETNDAFAQAQPRRRARPQVYVRPGRLLYRRCVGWLAVEHRLSGTVIVPRERCWWVRG